MLNFFLFGDLFLSSLFDFDLLLLVVCLKLLLSVHQSRLLGVHPLLLRILFDPPFFNNWFAPWAKPLYVLDSWATCQENGWDGLVGKIVLFAVSLQTRLNVKRAWAVIAAYQFTAVLAVITVVPIFDL